MMQIGGKTLEREKIKQNALLCTFSDKTYF